MKLTKEQEAFLESQGIPLSAAFDASSMPKSVYSQVMKKLGKLVAFGVTPCDRAGHTLRTRHGHCIQCGTHHLAFIQRYSESGVIYVAHSASKKLTKVGVTGDVSERIKMLNSYGYAGVNDWRVWYQRGMENNAGRVENFIHNKLLKYKISVNYEKEGRLVECQEVFDCGYEIATLEAMESIKYAESFLV